MRVRLAVMEDLDKINSLFDKVIDNMYKEGITIWNKYYPYKKFPSDIESTNLYLIVDDSDFIVASFTLCEDNYDLDWEDKKSRSLYLNRIGVNPLYLRQGIGKKVIESSINICKDKGYQYLRLVVVDSNKPAINLYLKNGFRKVNGIHKEYISEGDYLEELGFEMKIF